MICEKCGYEIKDENASFCPVCGEKIEEIDIKPNDDYDYVPLVKLAQQGDEQAFSELYEHYYPFMLKIALRHTMAFGKTNQQEAEDVLQDTMLKAYKNIKTLQKQEGFPAWLTNIVKNQARDFMKSGYKKNNVSISTLSTDDKDGKEIEYDPTDERETYQPETVLDNKTREDILKDVMSHLSEEQRIVTIMYFYDDMSMKEIAEELGIEQSTVVGRLQTAKKNIKMEISDIQKKEDIKLYNISAIPFFIWLLGKAQSEVEKEATKEVVKTVGNVATGHTIADASLMEETGTSAELGEDVINETTKATSSANVEEISNEAITTEKGNLSINTNEAANTAKESNDLANESIKTVSDSSSTIATTSSATTKVATASSISLPAKIAAGTALAVTVSVGGYLAVEHISNNSSSAPIVTSTNEEEIVEEDANVESDTQAEGNGKYYEIVDSNETSIDYGDVKVDIPDGWVGVKTVEELNGEEVPVIYLYENEVDENNKHVLIYNNTSMFVGDSDSKQNSQYLDVASQVAPYYYSSEKEGYYWVWTYDEEAYGDCIQIYYYDQNAGIQDNAFKKILSSIELSVIGYVAGSDMPIYASVYSEPNLDSETSDAIARFIVYVFEMKEDSDCTWYRVGTHEWINNKETNLNLEAF